jgi:hypothetical protein
MHTQSSASSCAEKIYTETVTTTYLRKHTDREETSTKNSLPASLLGIQISVNRIRNAPVFGARKTNCVSQRSNSCYPSPSPPSTPPSHTIFHPRGSSCTATKSFGGVHQRGCTAKRPNLSQSSGTTKTPEATKKIGPIFIFIFFQGKENERRSKISAIRKAKTRNGNSAKHKLGNARS